MMKLRLPAFNLRSISTLLTVLLSFALQTQAAVVLNNSDSGAGSLRQAILDATSGDTITFNNALAGQNILLTSGQLLIDKNLDIDASAIGGITIDGNGSISSNRIFEVAINTINVFDSLVLTNGLASGTTPDNWGGAIGINRGAMLTLNSCMLSGNTASQGGAILNYNGTLILNTCTLTDNAASSGGAIYNNGTLTLDNTTLSGNMADSGGSIHNAGTLTLINSTVAGNTANYDGGGIRNQSGTLTLSNSTLSGNTAGDRGGAIHIHTGILTLGTSTLSGNTAATRGGGIYISSGTATLNNSTLSGNTADDLGGGIFNNGTLNSTNSIVAENTASIVQNIHGTLNSDVNNITSGDPQLAPLGHHGGPTETMPPLPGSPAIDAGLDTGSLPATDQRGYSRVMNATVDIGAVETGHAIPGYSYGTMVNTTNDFLSGIETNLVSLRTALTYSTHGASLTFSPELSGQTILLTSGQLLVDKNITIDASAIGGITIDGNGSITSNRIFEIAANTTNLFDSLTLTNGLAIGTYPANAGGAVLINSGAGLTLTNSTLSGNTADDLGGAIFNNGTLMLGSSTLSGNTAGNRGGGINNNLGTLMLGNSTLSGNTAVNRGGGIYNEGTLNSTNSTLTGNTANTGGGIDNNYGTLTLNNSSLFYNSSSLGGGAIYSFYGTLTLGNATLTGNTTDNYGGAIYNDFGSTLTLTNSTLSGNTAVNRGGGIYISTGTVTLNNSTLSGNTSDYGGGGIYNHTGTLTLGTSTLSGNTADYGGGIFNITGTLNSTNSIVAGNTATIGQNIHGTLNSDVNNLTSGAPLLAALGNYGGPTQTMPPLPGSPAIDAGLTSATNSLTDQRGAARVAGATVDIGAVEFTLAMTVTSLADAGSGSLREAISFVGSGATITFTNALSGQTILLTSGQLLIDKNLAIDASAIGGITIDGNASVTSNRIFEIAANTTNVFDSLTLTHGRAAGTLAKDIRGGAIYIGNGASLSLNNSTLSGNTADFAGGGIYNDYFGMLALNNSTLSGNYATNNGGGICNFGTATLTNSTLSGNTADEAGGGIYDSNGFKLHAINSIIAGNTAAEYPNVAGYLWTDLHNLTSGDPLLAPLGDYGGPTQTMPPLPRSPARNAGLTSATNSLTDQRGFARVVGTAVDIGAVEATTEESYLYVTSGDDGDPESLRGAIDFALPGDTIAFDAYLDGATLLLDYGPIQLEKNLTIDASGLTGGIIIDGNGLVNSNRIFLITPNTTNVFDSLTLTNGLATYGGGILNLGNLTINRCTLSGNTADYGGGIYNNIGILTLSNSTLSGNSAANHGGGIYINTGILTIGNSTLSGNLANTNGGGIYNDTGILTLNSATLAGNLANTNGGGIFNNGTLTLENTIVAGNSAAIDANISGSSSGAHNLVSGDPLLAPLGDYGGPTQTMPPLPESPALDAGGTTTLTTDQRGFARILGYGLSVLDVGAVEFNGWLVGADLSGINPSAILTGSIYDATTVFPAGFDPIAAGLLKIQTPAEMAALVAQGEANITADPETYGLYNESAFQALALDRPFLTYNAGSNTFTLTVGILQTPDLVSTPFTNLTGFTTIPYPGDGQIDIEFTAPNADARFFQVYGTELPSP